MEDSVLALYAVYFETLRFLDFNFRKRLDEIRSKLPAAAVRVLPLPDALDALSQARDARLRTHASLALAWAHWARRRPQEFSPTDEIERNQEAIARFLNQLQIDPREVERAPSGDQAFLVPLSLLSCQVRKFWIRNRFHVGTDVTTCVAGVEVARRVDEFGQLADARIWQRTAAVTFAQTYRTLQTPQDPEVDPLNADAGGMNPPLGQP